MFKVLHLNLVTFTVVLSFSLDPFSVNVRTVSLIMVQCLGPQTRYQVCHHHPQ